MTTKVTFPTFELSGPPCENPGCSGVLVPSIHLKTQMAYEKCSVCGTEFHKMTAKEKMGWAVRTIERVLAGEGEN